MAELRPFYAPAPPVRTITRTMELEPEEVALIGHVRGYCHDGNACALCRSLENLRYVQGQLDSIATGSKAPKAPTWPPR